MKIRYPVPVILAPPQEGTPKPPEAAVGA